MASIYLSGSFFKEENDWRLSIVSPFSDPPLLPGIELDWLTLWGKLDRSILGYLDYTGPFPGDEFLSHRVRYAIEKSDFVFVWADQLTAYEVGWISAEIGCAKGFQVLVGLGSTSEDNPSYLALYGAESFGSSMPSPFIADSPAKAFNDFINFTLKFISPAKLVPLYLERPGSRHLLRDEYHRCGYVYIIKADTGEYKIGRSKNIPERMKLFAVKLPFSFEITHYFPCLDMFESESTLHQVYSSLRKRGEWFTLTREDEETLKRIRCSYSNIFADSNNRNVFRDDPRYEKLWDGLEF